MNDTHTPDPVQEIIERLEQQADRDLPPEETPEIGIIMGSDSDFDVMMGSVSSQGALDALTELGFGEQTDYDNPPDERFTFETYVVSAHRTPDLMTVYGRTARARGLEVLIAGAGGKSADLPNMTASIAYPLPVIGVPVQEKSVNSVIGMPTGAPLVAVDAGKSFNAVLSAVQFLSLRHEELVDRLNDYHRSLREEVGRVSQELHRTDSDQYPRTR